VPRSFSSLVRYLQSKDIEAPLPALTHHLPDITPSEGIYVIDTADLFSALEGDGENGQKRSLDRICKHLQVPTVFLHNAGNDAHYTMLAMKTMASGDPVDMQREKRWPNHTAAAVAQRGPKVNFTPWEEDSDYSDTEGIARETQGGYNTTTGELQT